MKVKDLIAELQKLNPEAEVYVWQGYNAGCMTTNFEIYVDDEGDAILEEGAQMEKSLGEIIEELQLKGGIRVLEQLVQELEKEVVKWGKRTSQETKSECIRNHKE